MEGTAVRVLGAVQLVGPGGPVTLGTRQRRLIAVLAARAGEVVPGDTLVEAIWGDDPPSHPTGALQTLVSRVRPLLPDGGIETHPLGYRLVAPTDAARVRSLLAGERHEQAATAADRLAGALRSWGRPAYGDTADLDTVHPDAVALDELRSVATERLARRLVELDRPAEAVVVLEPLLTDEPFRDRAMAVLMEALWRDGRQAEALRRFAAHQATLAEETGLEPSPELRRLELAILTGADVVAREGEPAAPAPPPLPLRLRPATVERSPGERITCASVGHGPPLVFLPGWISSIDAYSDGTDPRAALIAELARDHQVTVYDRYGTGLSPGPVEDFSLDAATAEVLAVVRRTGPGTTLLASSAAGPPAVRAALQSTDVSALVLLCTYADGPALFHDPHVVEAFPGLVRASWGTGSRLLADTIVPGIDPETPDRFARFQRRAATGEVAARYLEALYRADVGADLARIRQPTLVLHYRDDPAIPLAGGRQLAGGIAGATLVVLEGHFHTPPPSHATHLGHLVRRHAPTAAFAPRRSDGA